MGLEGCVRVTVITGYLIDRDFAFSCSNFTKVSLEVLGHGHNM